jgi:hypothetical protein
MWQDWNKTHENQNSSRFNEVLMDLRLENLAKVG